jgi:hypothetical protein
MANTTGTKFGGREAGTPNRLTSELRVRISDFLTDNFDQVQTDFKTLDPEKRIMIYEKLLSFVLPKMQSIQIPELQPERPIVGITFVDFAEERESNQKNE